MDTEKIQRSLKLYPIYEALSGDLLFYSVIEVLFLTMVKGFTESEIALSILLSNTADLLLEYPSYKIIKKLGNSRSIIIGGIMPVISIVLITLGTNVAMVTIGSVFFLSASNFQSIASASTRNNLSLMGKPDSIVNLFSKSNILYSVLSMLAAVIIPVLFSVNRFIPSALCFIVCLTGAGMSFYIRDYSETKPSGQTVPEEKKDKNVAKLSPVMRYLLIIFCMFFCAISVYCSNSELLISEYLGKVFNENRVILIFGVIVWFARILRMISNFFLDKIITFLKKSIVIIFSAVLFVAFAFTGMAAFRISDAITAVIIMGILYILTRGVIWDPLRTYLRMMAVDTNSKKKQQKMLILLNAGQSVVSILMRLVVFVVMEILSLKYVFPVFALIMVTEIVISILFFIECKDSLELTRIETKLTEGEIDNISDSVNELMLRLGAQRKEAAGYRMLIEEKLLERLNAGDRDKKVSLTVTYKNNEYCVNLLIDDKPYDVFVLSRTEDSVAAGIFDHLIQSLDM